jgi:hypothetical protein
MIGERIYEMVIALIILGFCCALTACRDGLQPQGILGAGSQPTNKETGQPFEVAPVSKAAETLTEEDKVFARLANTAKDSGTALDDRREAILALGRSKHPQATQTLLQLLDRPLLDRIAMAAIFALGERRDSSVVPCLEKLRSSSMLSGLQNWVLTLAIAKCKGPRAEAELRDRMRDRVREDEEIDTWGKRMRTCTRAAIRVAESNLQQLLKTVLTRW